MRLFWLIIAIFTILACVVGWAQVKRGAHDGPFASDRGSEATPAPPLDPGAVPTKNGGVFEFDEDKARDPGAMPSGEGEVIELGDLEREALELAEDLFDSALRRDNGASPGLPPTGGSTPPGATPPVGAGGPGHEHQTEVQQAENPWLAENGAAVEAQTEPLKHSLRTREDGTIVLDETFEIRGKGTAESPYEITWDLLMSAAETFQPRLGMNDLPERIQMLDGKYVRIAGHLLFPMIGAEAREVLVMLNMWDGCCIGTMPSPYDAIEVQLKSPVAGANRNFMNYGSLEGRLNVDPYLINDWLIGLYLMEDAKLNVGM